MFHNFIGIKIDKKESGKLNTLEIIASIVRFMLKSIVELSILSPNLNSFKIQTKAVQL